MSKQHVIAYIDGFNLYYAIKKLRPNAKWLDVRKLCACYLEDNQVLVEVKYFTAPVRIKSNNDTEKDKAHNRAKRKAEQNRQQLYWKALKSKGVIIQYGRFFPKPVLEKPILDDSIRKTIYHTWEEKRTDVGLATEMLIDAMPNERGEYKYDVAFLVSNDNDFVPLVRAVNTLPKRAIKVLFPPTKRGYSGDTRKAARGNVVEIENEDITSSQFPDEVVTKDGVMHRPSEWS